MKKIIFIISFLLAISYPSFCIANDETGVVKEQEETLGISSFIEESENYTKEVFKTSDLNTLYKDALSGNINLKGIPRGYFKDSWNRSYKNHKNAWIYINHNNCT